MTKLEELIQEINRFEAIVAEWDESQRCVVVGLQRAIEALHKVALMRLIKSLKKEESISALREAVDDEVVYGVLLYHELVKPPKPPLSQRIQTAIDEVRPSLKSHNGDVELVAIKLPDTVEVRFIGTCSHCPSSTLTLSQGIEQAIKKYCPEITKVIAVDKKPIVNNGNGLTSPFYQKRNPPWIKITTVDQVPKSGVLAANFAGNSLILHRQGVNISCYKNACAHLASPLDEGAVENGILTCPSHGFQYRLDTGECLTAPDVSLQSYPVKIKGDKVFCATPIENLKKLMHSPIKITPTSKLKREATEIAQRLPLSFHGAEVILGNSIKPETLVMPLAPSAREMFAPRGACLLSETGSLWVSDTGHHRLLGWRNLPTTDNQPADWVIGQPDFNHEGQNAKGTPGRATLSVPTGVCACGEGLAVADAWNHRVLIWKKLPEDNNVPADLVLGQANFNDNEPNRGKQEAAANTLNWCYGVCYYQGRLFVADTGNRRVLIWDELPQENGQPADLVLGQPDMRSRNENGGASPSASSMRWCHDITIWGDNLVVTDAGNNRVMIWQGIPTENNTPCAVVLGQKSFDLVEINQGVYFPSASSLSMPYGVAASGDWLLVADTANSRLLGWKKPESIISLQAAIADAIAGQIDFQSKGENRDFGLSKRDSLNWSYGIKVCGNTAVIADSGNNRVLIWRFEL